VDFCDRTDMLFKHWNNAVCCECASSDKLSQCHVSPRLQLLRSVVHETFDISGSIIIDSDMPFCSLPWGLRTGPIFLTASVTESKIRDIAQCYSAGLWARWSGVRVSAGAGNFLFTTVSKTALGAPPSLLSNRYQGIFPGVRAAGAWSWPLTFM
jgi:hypothetical protein